MDLKEYFENTKGFGVLSTADKQGKVDAAVYSKTPCNGRRDDCVNHAQSADP